MSIVMTKISAYIAEEAMGKVAVSSDKILGAVAKRYRDIEAKGTDVIKGMHQHNTYKQLTRMEGALSSRLGKNRTKELLDGAPYYHAVTYNNKKYWAYRNAKKNGSINNNVA